MTSIASSSRHASLLLAVCAVLLGGCATKEELRDAAVEDARAYVFSRMANMSEENACKIKFTRPYFLRSPVLGGAEPLYQTCVVWDLAGVDGKSLLVCGLGKESLRDWRPIRIVVKNVHPASSSREGGDPAESALPPASAARAAAGASSDNIKAMP